MFSRVSTTPATPADTSPIPKFITVRSRQVSHFSSIINSEGTCQRAVKQSISMKDIVVAPIRWDRARYRSIPRLSPDICCDRQWSKVWLWLALLGEEEKMLSKAWWLYLKSQLLILIPGINHVVLHTNAYARDKYSSSQVPGKQYLVQQFSNQYSCTAVPLYGHTAVWLITPHLPST